MNFLSSLSLLIFGTTKVLPSVQIQFKKSSGFNIEKVCYRYGHESIATKEICKKPNEELKFSFDEQEIRYKQGFDYTPDPFVEIEVYKDNGKVFSIPYDLANADFLLQKNNPHFDKASNSYNLEFDLEKFENYKKYYTHLSQTDFTSIFLSVEFLSNKRFPDLSINKLKEHIKNNNIEDVYIYSRKEKMKGDKILEKYKAWYKPTDNKTVLPDDVKKQSYKQYEDEEKILIAKQKYPNGFYIYSLDFLVVSDNVDKKMTTLEDAKKIEGTKQGLKIWMLTLKGVTDKPLKPFYKKSIRL